MRTLALSTVLALATSTSAWAQSTMPMPGMPGMEGMPGMQDSKAPSPAPHKHKPKPTRVALPKAPSASAPKAMEAMPGMGSVAPDQSAPGGQKPMPGDSMSGMQGMSGIAMDEQVGNEPAPAPPTDHAAERFYAPATMKKSRDLLRREHGGARISKVMLNLAEYQFRDGDDGYRWEGEAWYGGDLNRVVLKTEGEGGVKSGVDAAEAQILYSHAISPYFDLQAGVRQDFNPTPRRTYATISIEGLAPYLFETQGAVFVSSQGDVLGRLEGTYDLRLTQRMILQPRAEINLAAQNVPEIGIGSGVTNLELGLRLRYEIRREFAPYVGVSYDNKFGDTADYARARGEDPSQTSVVVGIRAWF